jgi:1-deoxy-D-xylulose-5-phosphate reductoisomerase
MDIHRVNAATVESVLPRLPAQPGLDDLLALDERARAHARQLVRELLR